MLLPSAYLVLFRVYCKGVRPLITTTDHSTFWQWVVTRNTRGQDPRVSNLWLASQTTPINRQISTRALTGLYEGSARPATINWLVILMSSSKMIVPVVFYKLHPILFYFKGVREQWLRVNRLRKTKLWLTYGEAAVWELWNTSFITITPMSTLTWIGGTC